MTITFNLQHTNIRARSGLLTTKHGNIATPCFMPVGTCGTVKAMKNSDLIEANSQIILGNTYHLMLRPGADIINKLGGLHKFINWNKPILTDSGGFQVMSLTKLCKVKEEGVIFNSHIDGKAVFLTPEKSIEIQHLLGSTITMCFDQCIKQPADYASTKAAMELSLRWALRSKDVYVSREGYGIFGIIQGGVFEDLRKYSTMAMLDIDFPGYAIGGLAVGETQETMFKILEYTTSLLPENKPRYLMGVGKPSDIIGAVHRGIDMFDCVLPTRSGRNGQAFVRGGVINIRNAKYINDLTSLDEQCNCYTCVNHTKAYLNHLIKSKEILGAMLMTIHNITHYNNMMAAIRYDIKNNMFHHSSATHKAFY